MSLFSFWFAPIVLVLWMLPSRRDETWPDEAASSSPHLPAGTQVMTEQHQHGMFGKPVCVIFCGWQVLVVACAVSYRSAPGGDTIGGMSAIFAILWAWLLGAVILALMMFFTRGDKVVTIRTT